MWRCPTDRGGPLTGDHMIAANILRPYRWGAGLWDGFWVGIAREDELGGVKLAQVFGDSIGVEGRGCLGDSVPDSQVGELRCCLNGGRSHRSRNLW